MINEFTLPIILSICIAIGYSIHCARKPDGVELNHVVLFSFGFLFYWILPFAIAPIVQEQVGNVWTGLFDSVRNGRTYLYTTLLAYCAFMLGDILAKRWLVPRKSKYKSVPMHEVTLFLAVVPLCICVLAFTAAYHAVLFQAYDVNVESERARGTVVACIVILGSIALLHISDHHEYSGWEIVKSRFTIPFIAGAAFLLILGSRLYVISFILIFLVYRSCFIHVLKLKTLMVAVTGLAIISGVVGVLRMGDNTTNIGVNLVLEPMFTSFSLLYFLNTKNVHWFAFPKYLLASFLNLIPTVLLPGKASLIIFPEVYAPLGALHSFVSFAYNFGFVGTVICMFFLPFFLRWVRAKGSSQLWRVSYSMISGWLMFSFWRDPFANSIVKSMVEFSIVVPSLLVLCSRFVQSTVPAKQNELSKTNLA